MLYQNNYYILKDLFFKILLIITICLLTTSIINADENTTIQNNKEFENIAIENSDASCKKVRHSDIKSIKRKDLLKDDFEGAHSVYPPSRDFGPVLVDLGLFINQLTKISPVDNSFKIEGYLDLIWCDPRLSFEINEENIMKQYFLEESASIALNRIWWPAISFTNEISKRASENIELVIIENFYIYIK